MGVGQRLREHKPDIQVYGVEPRPGESLQGLRSLEEGYRPPLLDLNMLNGRFLVDSMAAFVCVRRLVESEGICAGFSSGAVLHAARRLAGRMERGNIVVTLADSGWKYVNTDVWMQGPESLPPNLDDTHWW